MSDAYEAGLARLVEFSRQPPDKKRIGVCAHCGATIYGRRAKGALFCSGKCRTAAYRKRKPSPSVGALAEDLEWARAGEARLRDENASLQMSLRQLQAENAALRVRLTQLEAENARLRQGAAKPSATDEERRLAAEARRAKVERAEKRAEIVAKRIRARAP